MLSIKTKQDLINVITLNYSTIKEYGVKQIGFFGSFKRDEANELSDVDFYIDFYPEFKTLKNFVSLANFLKSITNRKVEIVTPQSLNSHFSKYILSEVEYVAIAA